MPEKTLMCPREGCGTMCKSPAGLKKHMTQGHGGWTAEEISTVLQNSPMPSESEEQAQGAEQSSFSEQSFSTENAEEPKKRKKKSDNKASIRMSDALGKFRTKISTMLPGIYTQTITSKAGIEGELTSEWSSILSELWGAYFDLLGFDISAEPLQFKIGGKWLTLLFPIFMLPLTFFVMSNKHRVDDPSKATQSNASEPIYVPEPPQEEEGL